jgi:hypothetical protein
MTSLAISIAVPPERSSRAQLLAAKIKIVILSEASRSFIARGAVEGPAVVVAVAFPQATITPRRTSSWADPTLHSNPPRPDFPLQSKRSSSLATIPSAVSPLRSHSEYTNASQAKPVDCTCTAWSTPRSGLPYVAGREPQSHSSPQHKSYGSDSRRYRCKRRALPRPQPTPGGNRDEAKTVTPSALRIKIVILNASFSPPNKNYP